MAALGIDLGTTNSCICRIDGGRPVPIPIDGSPILPSVVLFEQGRVVVGREARNLELANPEATVRSVKRRMGQDHRYATPQGERSPEEVSAEILKALRRGAEAALGEPVRDLVITVPAYFDDAQRRATLRAGELAGLNVLRLLNEPTSASLVYDQVGAGRASDEPEIVLVYDLGGGTFDVSVLEVVGGVREVRATNGNTHLGGDDFDERLVGLFLEHLGKQGARPAGDARAMARLRRLAESTKIALSADTSTRVSEQFVSTDAAGRPVHLELTVTRRELEERIGELLESTVALSRKALDDARLEGQKLSRVCLVGGSTRIPMVRRLLAEAFDADIHEEIDPDLAVGLGAAMQAGLLAGAPIERILVDVAAHSLGVLTLSDLDRPDRKPDTFAPVLRRNTVLPAVRTEEFYTLYDDQERVQVQVFQGEAPRASQNAKVGEFSFPLKPSPEGTPVRVEFSYDLTGVIRVTAEQVGYGNAKAVSLTVADAGNGGLAAKDRLERMARALL